MFELPEDSLHISDLDPFQVLAGLVNFRLAMDNQYAPPGIAIGENGVDADTLIRELFRGRPLLFESAFSPTAMARSPRDLRINSIIQEKLGLGLIFFWSPKGLFLDPLVFNGRSVLSSRRDGQRVVDYVRATGRSDTHVWPEFSLPSEPTSPPSNEYQARMAAPWVVPSGFAVLLTALYTDAYLIDLTWTMADECLIGIGVILWAGACWLLRVASSERRAENKCAPNECA